MKWIPILGGCLLATLPISVAAAERPNILLVMIDDLGWRDLGCQGNAGLHTPRIDALAGQGMRFTSAYAAAPVCSPTRAAILTGQSPARLRLTNHLPHQERFTPKGATLRPAPMRDHLPLEHVTVAEHLKAAGYATGFFGKWHLYNDEASEFGPLAQGFEVNLGGCAFGGPPTFFDPYGIDFLPDRIPGEYLPDRLADETIGFMRARVEEKKPFFAALWHYTVHWPMETPMALLEKYRDRPAEGYKDARYAAMIEAMDAAVGRVLDALEVIGIADETLVVFTSDNGAFDGVGDNRPLRASKGHLYEGGIRVPMIVRWPGKVAGGEVSEVPVISTDLYPTFLECAGVEPDPGTPMDGVRLLALLQGKDKPEREALFWHYPNYASHQGNRLGSAMREGDFKLIEHFDDGSVELYDLGRDLSEKRDLAGEKPEIAERMKARLQAWRMESGAAMPVRREGD